MLRNTTVTSSTGRTYWCDNNGHAWPLNDLTTFDPDSFDDDLGFLLAEAEAEYDHETRILHMNAAA